MIHYMTTNGIGNAWVANELSIMRKAGVPFELHTMRKPKSIFHRSQWAAEINKQTIELYPLPIFGLIISIVFCIVFCRRRFWDALLNALIGKRENTRARIACLAHFFVACHWVRIHRRNSISHIHSQWAHSCCSIAMYAAWMMEKTFSFTGHGTDLWRDRVALEDKIRRAVFIACISNFHRELYLSHGAMPEQLQIVYCGIDINKFAPAKEGMKSKDGKIRIRSAGRLVEKKGFSYLINACKILADRRISFECKIAGSGPLGRELREAINRNGLDDYIVLTENELKQEDISNFVHSGNVFCLPCVWASDNDADGLPQMLMEAMACGLPVISTKLVGIPDLIIDGETGLLVAPNNAEQLANAIERLSADHELATQIARRGREHIISNFELESALQPLIRFFRSQLVKNGI